MFRPSDQRRVQAILDERLPAPYEATVTLADERRTMHVAIADPDDDSLPVANCVWIYDPSRKLEKQPSDNELAAIAGNFVRLCEGYPEAKAANQRDHAARVARQGANLKARAEDAEKRLKSAAAKVLAAEDITPAMVDAIQTAADALD